MFLQNYDKWSRFFSLDDDSSFLLGWCAEIPGLQEYSMAQDSGIWSGCVSRRTGSKRPQGQVEEHAQNVVWDGEMGKPLN